MIPVTDTFILVLAVIAVAAMTAGVVLAVTGYSSAGPFSIASACVGVLAGIAIGAKPEPGDP
jgi:hypothetical protein